MVALDWDDQVVFLTGGATGIGRALARRLAGAGASLAIVDLNEDGMEETVDHASFNKDDVLTFEVDVTDEDQMKDAVEETVAEFGDLTLGVANAGLGYPTSGDDLDLDDVKQMLDVNIYGVLTTLVPCIEHMKQSGGGHLAITSSAAAFHGLPNGGPYSASKAAVLRLGESFRYDLGPHDIDVTTIHPGWIETPMTNQFEDTLKFNQITADQAAGHIQWALEKKKKQYIFPRGVRWMIRLLQWSPDFMVNLTLSNTPSPEGTLRSEPRTRDQIGSS